MPARQRHRGAHPQDEALFSSKWVPVLREGSADLSWLYTRGYSDTAAIKLVGDHFQLAARQRMALQRAACSDESLLFRRKHCVTPEALTGARMEVDGYNLLITLETTLSGGLLIGARDGCLRDLASLHGTYKRVEETLPALGLAGAALQELRCERVLWLFDAPVSNSGRLAGLLREQAAEQGWEWEVELEANPDKRLAASKAVVITSDSWILNRAARWFNLTRYLGEEQALHPWIVALDTGQD